MEDELKMSVSPICVKNGKKYAFISFTDGQRVAEGKIPDCIITKNHGFDTVQVQQLETYMKQELPNLKKMAAQINVLDNFLYGDEQ